MNELHSENPSLSDDGRQYWTELATTALSDTVSSSQTLHAMHSVLKHCQWWWYHGSDTNAALQVACATSQCHWAWAAHWQAISAGRHHRHSLPRCFWCEVTHACSPQLSVKCSTARSGTANSWTPQLSRAAAYSGLYCPGAWVGLCSTPIMISNHYVAQPASGKLCTTGNRPSDHCWFGNLRSNLQSLQRLLL